jgi:hypothetical protein
MARLHCGVPTYLPKWWEEYANSWGISVAPPALAVLRRRYNTNSVYTEHRGVRNAVKACSLSTLTPIAWEDVARALEKAAPKPGTTGYLGGQIRLTGKRHILDLPPGASSLVPSLRKDGEIYAGFLSSFCARQSFKESALMAWSVIQAVFSFVASAVGGAAVAAALGAMQTAYAGACTLLSAVASISNGDATLETGWDVVQGIGKCVSAVGAAPGRDVAEMIPGDAWQALTTVGAQIPSWGGDLRALVGQDARTLQAQLCGLRDVYGWDYLDEGFSSLVGGKS